MATLSSKVAPTGVATLVSPALTGTPTAPTAAAGTNTTQLATTAYTRMAIPNVLNASGSAPVYACRAWVNFNGSGTVAIRASGNVSSITDNGTGDYTVNFATAMPDGDYTPVAMSNSFSLTDGSTRPPAIRTSTYTASASVMSTTQLRVLTGPGPGDVSYICLAFFR